MTFTLNQFITESNRIEGITRPPTLLEISVHQKFLALYTVTVRDLEDFVRVIQPGARLRRSAGMDVRVGNFYPPRGGSVVVDALKSLLDWGLHPTDRDLIWKFHIEYEQLHPFTDGNGRSGRVQWLRHVGGTAPIGFLHSFYYQTLNEVNIHE